MKARRLRKLRKLRIIFHPFGTLFLFPSCGLIASLILSLSIEGPNATCIQCFLVGVFAYTMEYLPHGVSKYMPRHSIDGPYL